MSIDPHIVEWLNLLLRWIHLIVGIAWIGSSFYFNWLEGHLERGPGKPPGVAGDIWSVHGGGFYHAMKYEVAPAALPARLHWFYWEAYSTWLSGFCLLIVVYYLNAGAYMVDPAVADISPAAAIGIGLGALVIGWLVYDAMCKSALGHRPALLAALGYGLIVALGYGLSQWLGGRAAYIHVGAVLGTIMVANVAHVIIPGQRRMVRAMENGEAPDPEDGRQALIRSRQNNYLTLPVLLIMISNHFPSTFAHRHNWLILAALVAIGVLVRHYYNLKHKGQHGHWMLILAAAALAAVAWFAAPPAREVGAQAVSDAQAQAVIRTHCLACHSVNPSDAVFRVAPNGVVFDTVADMRRHAAGIKARSVDTASMPLGNPTGMSERERQLLGDWIAAGAAQ